MRKTYARLTLISLLIIFLGTIFIFHHKVYHYSIILPPLENHLYPSSFTSLYENIVLLSCSSDSYSPVYCYYLPYVALAWRRIGFEPIVFLVGSDEIFRKMPLFNLLKNDLKIKYYFINADPLRSISTSQIIRLFGGFLSYEYETTKDIFILMADVDLIPISRHRFEIDTNQTNYILAVNAYCCRNAKFSYGQFHDIHYYPISYVGMRKNLWKKLFLPLKDCKMSSEITIDMIECCLNEKINQTIPKNVIKGTEEWDLDQELISLLIAQAQHYHGTFVDKRRLGYRLNPDKKFLSSEFDSILSYDDVHLPTVREDIIFSNQTWLVLNRAFSYLFQSTTMQLLSRYHYQTAAFVLRYNTTTTISHKNTSTS